MRPLLKMVFAISLTCGCYSCSDEENLVAFESLRKDLDETNEVISGEITRIHYSLERKATDPITAEKAKVLIVKENLINSYSNALFDYVDALKSEIKRASRLKIVEGEEVYRRGDKSAGQKVLIDKGKLTELKRKLREFSTELISIDSTLEMEFKSDLAALGEDYILETKGPSSPSRLPTSGILAGLSGLQSKVRIQHFRIVDFLNRKITGEDVWFDTTSVLTGINSSYVKKGDEVEVFAGVGAFSIEAKPEILFNGKAIKVGPDGVATYKFNAPANAGKHSVVVTVKYTVENGLTKSAWKRIVYTVVRTTDEE